MDTELLPSMLEEVSRLGLTFAGVVYLAMEFLVKPLTRRKLTGRKQLRAFVGALLSVLLPVVYLTATGRIPWGWALPVLAVSFGASYLTARRAKANEDR